jgi:uncharacterized protein YukE
MSQIKADTDALRATIAAMRQGSSTIENALQQAAQAMTTLQSSRWSGNHRQQAEEVWTRLQAQFAPTIEALNQIAARTERFTNALEEAGRVFGDGGVSAPGINPRIPPDFPAIPRLPILPAYPKDPDWITLPFKFQGRWFSEHLGNVSDLFGLYKGNNGLLTLIKKAGPFMDIASLGLTLTEKSLSGELTPQVAGAEVTKTMAKILISGAASTTGVGTAIIAANAAFQSGGALFNAGTEALAGWVAGPEYDGQIAENARRMNDALKKADLMSPINNTIDVLWQGQFDKALPTFWESTVDIGEGYAEYVDAAGDQLAIIGAAASEKLAPVIDQTIQGVKDTGAAVVRQVQEQTKQFFDSIINSSGLGGLFRFR